MTRTPVLTVKDLNVSFVTAGGTVHAVKDASLSVSAGETVVIAGESGAGKRPMVMAVMGLLSRTGQARGSAKFVGQELIDLPARELNGIRGSKITMIFQDPLT